MERKLSLSQQLEIATFKLDMLLEVTKLINDDLSPEMLFNTYKEILVKDFSVGNFLLFVKNATWHCMINNGIYGVEEQNIDALVGNLQQYTKIEKIDFLHKLYTVIPIFHREKSLAYLLITDRNTDIHGSPTETHLDFIQTITNIIVSAIENKNLYEEKLEKESLKKELEVASRMQAMLIPNAETLPQNEHISVASFYAPHSQVSGDYFDCIQLSETDYGFCIADVSGKGVAAAILMANFQANVRAFARLGVQVELPYIVKELDVYINKFLQGEKFITFFIARYNIEKKLLHYVNAGHNPPLFWSAKEKNIRYCTEGSVGLGMLDHIDNIVQGKIYVAPGDKILCYTDGLSEAENEKSEEFGTHEIEIAIAQQDTIQDSIDYLQTKLQEFLGTQSPNDDISILGIDFKN
ncbi:MAG: PP2C family protein-serine/threonine phosphatase [Bacteroidales bacterium]|jgi:sigma-B regulation protein RsbU (phosphoserine phosphatase)|nr:PP2C family protein-serine/threonine phosphatase [Bacteroidales bacterium]